MSSERLNWMVLGVAAACGLTSCASYIRSELAAYAEPSDGALAHVRLVGSRNVKVYPNSTCVSAEVPGSGYPAGPQMGGQRKRDLGMPKVGVPPNHFVEVAARADQPITVNFAFYIESSLPGAAGTGMPSSRRSSSCTAALSFVPQTGQNYEVEAGWDRRDCSAHVVQLSAADTYGSLRRLPVANQSAKLCRTPAEAERR